MNPPIQSTTTPRVRTDRPIMPDGIIANDRPTIKGAIPARGPLIWVSIRPLSRKMRIALISGANSICDEKSFLKKKSASARNNPIFSSTEIAQMLPHISVLVLNVIILLLASRRPQFRGWSNQRLNKCVISALPFCPAIILNELERVVHHL